MAHTAALMRKATKPISLNTALFATHMQIATELCGKCSRVVVDAFQSNQVLSVSFYSNCSGSSDQTFLMNS